MTLNLFINEGRLNAFDTVERYTREQVEYVQCAYDKYCEVVGEAYMSDKMINRGKLKQEMAEVAYEDDLLDFDEFEELWKAIGVLDCSSCAVA